MNESIREELEQGRRLQREGNLAEAEAIYGRVLALKPQCADAWHLFGLCRHQAADFPGAVGAISRAIVLDASREEFFNNYGAALQRLGRCPDAVTAYRAALHVRPNYLDALVNLSRALNQLRQHEAAYRLCKERLQVTGDRLQGNAGEAAPRRLQGRVWLLEQAAAAARGCGRLDEAAGWMKELADLQEPVA